MKKLRLHPESLRVESFTTAPPAEAAGTVHAHAPTLQLRTCPAAVCQTYDDTLCGLTHGCA